MNDQEAREFVEMLAVPASPEPPPCPICGCSHPLETQCSRIPAHDLTAGASGERVARIGGQLVFHDRDTGRTLTATYSIYITGDSDINSQGCTWQGTVTAAG